MAGVEAFTILAILDARDRISGVINRVDETLNQFAATGARAAEAARAAGASIDQSLLQTASGANALEVANARLSASQARLALATQELAGAERELIAADEAAARAAVGDAAAMARQSEAAERLAAAQQMVTRTSAEVAAAQSTQAATADAAALATSRSARAMGALRGSAAAAGVALRSAGKFAMGAGLAAAAIGYESVKAYQSFETLTMRIVTTAGEAKKNLDTVRKGILDISTSVGVSADEVSKGMYMVESAGYRSSEAIKVLRAVTEGAAIEGADFGTVANAVTDVLKDYHWGADKATEATDTLIRAVSFGKTNFQNLAASMANVLPLASSLHVKINDVTGVLAEMTAHGMTAQRASFNIANAMRSIMKPTNMMSKELKLFGLTSQDLQTSLGKRGLAGTLQWLSDVAKKGAPAVGQTYNEALGKMIGTATGLQVALLTTGENAKDTNRAIAGIGKTSSEASGHVEGFAELQGTIANKMDRAKTAIHNAGIAIGSALLPAVSRIATKLAEVVTPIAGWVEQHKRLTAIVLGSLMALGVFAALIWSITTAVQILLSPVTLIVLAIAGVAAIVVYAYKHFRMFHLIVDKLGTFLKTVFVGAWKAVGAIVQWFTDKVLPTVRKAIEGLISWFSAHKDAFKDAWDDVMKGIHAIVQWFNDNVLQWLKDRVKDFVSWWHDHGKQIEAIWHALWGTIKTIAQAAWTGFINPLIHIMWDTVKTVWQGIWDATKLIWDAIKNTITFVLHLIMNVIAVVLDVVTGNWGKAWKDLKKLAGDAIKDAWRFIKDLFSDAGSLLWNAGKNIIMGLINGIKSMIGGVAHAIGGVVGTIKDHLPWSPAKMGPLSGSGAPEIGGANIIRMMSKGIVSGVPWATEAMNHVLDKVQRQRERMAGATISVAGDVGGGFVGGGGRGGTVLNFDFRGTQVMSDREIDNLVGKIGQQVATRILPAGGVRIRM